MTQFHAETLLICFLLLQTPIEFLGHMQRTYDRALAMYGREAGCYVPPRMLEEDLKEDLRLDL